MLLGVYNFSATIKSNQEAKNIVNEELPLLIANQQLALTMANRVATARGYVLYGDDYKERFHEYTEQGKYYEDIVREIHATEEFDRLIEQTVAWRMMIDTEVFAEYDKGNREIAYENLGKSAEMVRELVAGYEKMAEESQLVINEIEQDIVSRGENTLRVVTTITILVVLLSMIAAFLTSNIISKPIKMVMERMRLIANGDLSSEPLQTKSIDEVGHLVSATNEMSNRTRELLNKIHIVSESVTGQSEELTQSATEVKAATHQIALTMHELAMGSETQANSASDLSSIMGSFTNKVEEVNEKGEYIQQSSTEVLSMTSEGGRLMETSSEQMVKIDQIVQDAVQKIQGLDTQSQEISKLVIVIQNIAAQTNLLALNAAIEAARAGEHWKVSQSLLKK